MDSEVIRMMNVRTLGEGTYGNVFRVQLSDGHYYAVKVPKKQLGAKAVEQFKREAVIHERIRDICHPHLLCFTRLIPHRDTVYLVTEYLENYQELFNLISEDTPQNNRWLTKVTQSIEIQTNMFKQMIMGVHLLHERGIAHSDIKPENMMIHMGTYNVKLIDFGLSCMEDTCGENAGSATYLAPEAIGFIRNKVRRTLRQSMKLDIWALGLVIYMCIVLFNQSIQLQMPYEGYDEAAIIAHDLPRIWWPKRQAVEKIEPIFRVHNLDVHALINPDPEKRNLMAAFIRSPEQ